ncbi:hypothetical protein C802_01505 [Phocaeicola sartorii]|uniref:Uncharacterized protein n=1 Tax=Phocaeicola sartorii TaxID=671267 RepID=R9IA19_9BACT|nr:hypothetical protein C802_01505 [Phocaeicola sartorii]
MSQLSFYKNTSIKQRSTEKVQPYHNKKSMINICFLPNNFKHFQRYGTTVPHLYSSDLWRI